VALESSKGELCCNLRLDSSAVLNLCLLVALNPGVSYCLTRAPLSQLKCTLKGHLSRPERVKHTFRESLLFPSEQILTAMLPLGKYQMSSSTSGRCCSCGGWMLRVGKSDNYKCPLQVQEKFQEFFADWKRKLQNE